MYKTKFSKEFEKLHEGYILDKRYRITRLIGEGGFGITYEAENIHSGKRVAVKANCQGDPQKFLQEARTLRDFSEESAIVSVLDYFEENGTAYIVMEYLDGIPLSSEIKKNGKWTTEKAVHSFVPVMKALENMHLSGVIHRDISPDNLMVMPDRSLILMDFGAVTEIHEHNFTRNSIYKSIYSPPEQRESGLTLGSYTDVYALCATLYFCITGQEPEDALSRLLFDELKKPSECGADIKSGSEKALMNGLDLDVAERTQNVAELRNILENDYPDLTEEEKRAFEKKRKIRKKIFFIICCVLSVIILGLLYKFRINILFTTIDTQKVLLQSSSMSKEDFRNNAEIVRERVKVFSENKYLWKEDQETILFEVPSELFLDKSPIDVTRFTLSRPMVISIYIRQTPDKLESLGIFSQEKDIKTVKTGENGLDITFTKTAAERFNGALNEAGKEIVLAFDTSDFSDHHNEICTSNGDGQSIHIDTNSSGDEFIISDQLKALILTTQPATAPFTVQAEWKVRWEDVNNTMFPGKNQINWNEIPLPAILIKYVPKNNREVFSGYNLSQLSFQAALKNRLDSLDFPYAVGMDKYEKDTFVIKFPAERYFPEEADYLPENIGYDLSFGSSKTMNGNIHPSGVNIVSENDSKWQLETSISGDYSRTEMEELFQVLRQQNEINLYLYYHKTRLFVCPIEEAYNSFHESGKIYFKKWLSANYPEMNASTKHFGDFLETCLFQKLPTDVNYKIAEIVELRDEKDKMVTSDISRYIPASLTENKQAREQVDKWKQEYADTLKITYNDNVDDKILRVTTTNSDISNPSEALKTIESFIRKNTEALESGNFQYIFIYILPDSDPEISWLSVSNPGKPLLILTMNMDYQAGRLLFTELFHMNFYQIPDITEMEKIYNTFFESSPFWKQYLRPEIEETIP